LYKSLFLSVFPKNIRNFVVILVLTSYYFTTSIMTITLIILAVAAVFFAIGKVRSDIVALCALVLLIVFGVLTPQEALSGFSNSVVIMMAGLFIVGGAVLQTGLAKMIGGRIMRLAGQNELMIFLLVVLVTAFIGAFVSNTGTVALMLPIVVSMAALSKTDASRLLMPLAFASSMGGMLTLIGTPPNLVVQDALTNAGYEPLSFFSFSPIGLVCIAVGIVVLLPLSKWLLSKKGNAGNERRRRGKSLADLVEEYRLNENLHRLKVGAESKVKGKTIAELDVYNRYRLTILEVRREKSRGRGILVDITQAAAGPNMQLDEGDIIYLTGEEQQVEEFAADYTLASGKDDASLDFFDIGMAEIVLMLQCKYVGRQLKDTDFRRKYNVNIMGVRRDGEYITDNLPEVKMHAGDVLLVQGTWENIARLGSDEDHWVVLGQPLEEASRVTLDYKAPLAAAIMLAMVAMMVFDFIPVAPVTAVLIASILMILSGCFRSVEAAYKTINWESIVLIAAMMPMSIALEKTGTSAMISHGLADGLGEMGPLALLAGIYFTTSLLTMFISNTATAVLMAPIAIASSTEMQLSPYPFLLAVTVAASMCFASPFSTPPNALVMKAGQYTFMDYIKVGLPLQIIMGIVMILILPLLFPM
jgi:di/tricarboxylate transporter